METFKSCLTVALAEKKKCPLTYGPGRSSRLVISIWSAASVKCMFDVRRERPFTVSADGHWLIKLFLTLLFLSLSLFSNRFNFNRFPALVWKSNLEIRGTLSPFVCVSVCVRARAPEYVCVCLVLCNSYFEFPPDTYHRELQRLREWPSV
jgi:hypothetical protein